MSNVLLFMYPNFSDNINCVCSSPIEPNAMYKNLINSLSEPLKEPSAIFDGIETEHLLS